MNSLNVKQWFSQSADRAAKILIIGLATISLLFTCLTHYFNKQMGFPDGYLTTYEKAIKPFLTLTSALCLIISSLFWILLVPVFSKHIRKSLMITFTIIFCLLIITRLVILPWYFGVYLGLENGKGG